MSNSLALYSTILKQIRTANPKEDTYAARKSLPGWSLECWWSRPSACRISPMRLSPSPRPSVASGACNANTYVQVRAHYDSLIRHVLAKWMSSTLYIAMNTTGLAGRLVICRLALIYQCRAIPLIWQVYDCLTLMPPAARVVLLGDKGFRSTEVMRFCHDHLNWHFRLRLQGGQFVRLPDIDS